MKSPTVHFPATTKDLRIKHLGAIEKIQTQTGARDRIEAIAIMAEASFDDLVFESNGKLKKMAAHIGKLLNNLRISEPKKEIELDGNVYQWVGKDIGRKQPGGWFIDAEGIAGDKHEYIAALCYIEKGMVYAQRDERTGAILNPLEDRAKVMAEHLPLQDYLNVLAFFFKKHKQLETGYLWLQAARVAEALDVVKSTGLKSSTSSQPSTE